MKWTNNKPKVEGFYFWRHRKASEATGIIVHVAEMPVTKKLRVFSVLHSADDVKHVTGQWSDTPIQPPEE